jgi:hypothetical protein
VIKWGVRTHEHLEHLVPARSNRLIYRTNADAPLAKSAAARRLESRSAAAHGSLGEPGDDARVQLSAVGGEIRVLGAGGFEPP